MWKQNQLFASLQKNLQESQKILSQPSNLSSEIYHNIIKEQTKLENNKMKLANIKAAYEDELKNLKQILLSDQREDPSEYQNTITELKEYIGFSLNGTQEKILAIEQIEYFDKSLKERIQFCFEETFQKVNSAFTKFRNIQEASSGNIDLKKLETMANSNLLALNGIEAAISQTKRRIVRTLAETDNCISLYSKEAQSLIESIDQAKENLASTVRDNREGSRNSSPLNKRNNDVYASTKSRQYSDNVELTFEKIASLDAKKNKIFNNTKGELEKICGKLKPIVKDFMKHTETLKSNHQILELIINRQSTKQEKFVGSPSYKENRDTKRKTNNEEKEAFNPYATWSHNRMASPEQIGSPLTPNEVQSSKLQLSRSPMSFGDLRKHREFEAKSPTTGELPGRDAGQLVLQYQKAFDIVIQKIKHLQNTSYNLLISCEKVSNLVQNRSEEEEFVIQVFGNDKKLFENYLNSLLAFVKEAAKNISDSNPFSRAQGGRNEERHSPDYLRKRNQFKEEWDDKREEEDYEFKLRVRKAAASLEPFRENFRRDDRFETNVLSSGFGTVIPKRDKSNERNQKRESQSPEKPQSRILITNLMDKLKEQTEKNEKLKKENSYMIKLTKKLELKASERKKSLKQLFELLTEKEKELNFFKGTVATSGISIKNSQVIEVKDFGAINEKQKLDEAEKTHSSQEVSDKEVQKDIKISLPLSKPKEQKDQAKEAALEMVHEQLITRNLNLENQCKELEQEIEKIKETQQNVLKTKLDEIEALNQKVKQLTENNQELQRKYNEKVKEITNALSADSPSAQADKDETYLKELNNKLKSELKVIIAKLEDVLASAGLKKEDYGSLHSDEKIDLINDQVKKQVEKGKKEEALQKEVQNLQISLAKEASNLEETETSNRELTRKLQDKEKEVRDLTQKLENRDNAMLELERELIMIKEDIKEKQRLVEEREKELNENEKKIEEIQVSSLKDLEVVKSKAVQETEGYEIRINNLTSDLTTANIHMQNLQAELRSVKNELDQANTPSFGETQNELDKKIQEITSLLQEKSELENKIVSLKETVSRKEEIIAQLEISVNNLETDKESLQSQNQELIQKMKLLNEESTLKEKSGIQVEESYKALNSQLETEKKSLQEKIIKLENQIKEHQSQEIKFAEEIKNFNQEINNLKENLQERENSLEKAEKEWKNLSSINNELSKENERIKNRIEELEKSNGELRGEKEVLLAEKALVNQESSQAINDIKEKITEYERNLQQERTRVRELERDKDELQKQKEKLQNEYENIKTDAEHLKNLLDEVKNDKQKIVQELNHSQESHKERESILKREIEELEEKLVQAEKIRISNEEELHRKENELVKVKESLEKVYDELEQERKNAEEARKESQTQLEKIAHDHAEEITKVVGEANLKEKNWTEQVETLENEKIKNLKEREELLGRINELNQQIKELETGVDALNKENTSLKEDIVVYKKANEENQNQSNSISTEYTILQNQHKKLEGEHKALQETQKALEQDKQGLNKQIENLKSEIDLLEKEKIKNQDELKEMKNLLEETKRKLQKENDDVSEKYKQLNENHENLKQKFDKLTEENARNHSQVQSLGSEVDSLRGALKARETEVDLAKNFSANEMDTIKNKYISQIADLTVQVEVAKRSRDELEKEYETKKQESKEYQEKSEKLFTEKSALEKQVKNDAEEAERLLLKLKEAEESMKSLNQQIESLKGGREELEKSIKELEARIHQHKETESLNERLKAELEERLKASEEKINVITQENTGLTSQNEQIETENRSLKASVLSLQDELKDFAQTKERENKNNEIIKAFNESLVELNNLSSFKETNLSSSLQNKEEIQKAIRVIETIIQRKEDVNSHLAQELEKMASIQKDYETTIQNQNDLQRQLDETQKGFSKERQELKNNIEALEEEAINKIKVIKEEIKVVLKSITNDNVPDLLITFRNENVEDIHEFVKTYFGPIKAHISKSKELETNYNKVLEEIQEIRAENGKLTEKLEQIAEEQRNLEKNKDYLDKENQTLKTETNQLREMYMKKESEIEEIKKSLYTEKEGTIDRGEMKEPSFSVQEDIDDVKVKSFLEESVKIETRNFRKDEKSTIQEQEQLRVLYEQLRILQDENDKLENENKQIRTNYEMLGFTYEDTKADLLDAQEEVGKANFQLAILKEEFAKLQKEKDREGRNAIAHERQHIRTIFIKFMQSALEGNKDAPDLLRALLSLMDLSETDKNKVLNDFKTKSAPKKGVFGKLF